MSIQYVKVSKEEGNETIELPIEHDGCLLVSTFQSIFPGSTGLTYRNSVSNAIRGIRMTEGRLHPPSEDGWGDLAYFCVFPDKELPSIPPSAAAPVSSFELWCGRIIGVIICIIIAILFNHICSKCTNFIEKLSYVNTILTFITFMLIFVNYLFKKNCRKNCCTFHKTIFSSRKYFIITKFCSH